MIRFSFYFTNHLNKRIRLDDNIVDVSEGFCETTNKKIFQTLTFTTNKIYYDPKIIGV